MTQRYTHESRAWAQRILGALLPEGVTANVTLLREGWGIDVTICGKSACRSYEFAPGLTEYHLIQTANQWKTGDMVLPATAEPRAADSIGLFVDTVEDLQAWVRTARRGQRVVYFTGNLAQFRSDASKEVVTLQARGDEKASGNGITAAERLRLTTLQVRLAMLAAVSTLQNAGMIDLTQLRMSDGTGFTYYAVKR